MLDPDLPRRAAAHVHERRQQAVVTRSQPQRARHIAVDRLESAHVAHVAARDGAQEPVGDAARDALARPFLAAAAVSRHERVALLQLAVEEHHVLGLMLEIAVGDDDHAAPRGLDARIERAALADVAREDERPQAGVLLDARAQQVVRAVGRAVRHDDHLVGDAHVAQRCVGAAQELLHAAFLVVHGCDDGDLDRIGLVGVARVGHRSSLGFC
jgi:hypothetical protein